ncbi:polyprenyl diphosphate synthase [Propioniferax innocua]|uniref:Isoprenyl transferase n=1 Tax=Propioniferax innocua TaxID=1753 RepID=A0A542ZC22_9ACTN|nr:polyprenyl diphosphate synthase [Propioniferax innocua]TQL57857.1 undecaprenyl pyrophosphate synthetase [Propioniferax innocua]
MALGDRLREAVTRMDPTGLVYAAYERHVIRALDPAKMPHHVAVMADGNRRWARQNAPGQPLVTGYRAGAAKLRQFVEWSDDLGIEVATIWVLSTENFQRSADAELGPLLDVIAELVEELADTGRWPIRTVGALELLPDEHAERLRAASARSVEGATGRTQVNIAVSYGGRHELRDAVRSLLREEALKGRSLEEVADTLEMDDIAAHLYTAGQPDPDLVIRTSGEQRLSGFLIWQSAHSEFWFCEALWPDFRKVDFVRALRSFSERERRFGK